MAGNIKLPLSAAPVAEGARFTIGSATAFAVRREGKDIALRIRRERRPLKAALGRIPFVRGMQRLVLCAFGWIDAISESSELEPQRIVRGTRAEQAFSRLFRIHPESLVGFLSGLMVVLLLTGFTVGLPKAVEAWILPNFELTRPAVNGIVCFARILGLLAGFALCARLRVVNRLCMYRGAINKVLNAYEARRRAPTLEEALSASRVYRRCDAAFLAAVIAASLIGFAAIRTFTLPIQILVRVLTVFAAAAVVNEPIQLLEDLDPENPLSRLLAPCLWIERLFTIEPHSQMVEVALCAFNAARENDDEE